MIRVARCAISERSASAVNAAASGSTPWSARSGGECGSRLEAASPSTRSATSATRPNARTSRKRISRPSPSASERRTYGSVAPPAGSTSSCPVMRKCTSSRIPPESSTMIHFARRRAPRIRRPRTASVNEGASGVERFRSRKTCAPVIVAPLTSRARSRTTVSTSGSSGTSGPRLHLVPSRATLHLNGEWHIKRKRPLHRLHENWHEAIHLTVRHLQQ